MKHWQRMVLGLRSFSTWNCLDSQKQLYKRTQSNFVPPGPNFTLIPSTMEQSTFYNFSASVPIIAGRVTYLKFAIPEASDAQTNTAPTITRDFSSR